MSKNQSDGNDDIHSPRLDVTISQVDRSLPLPRYATSGSVGFDLFCRVDTVIEPGEIGLAPGNVIVHTPPGYGAHGRPAQQHPTPPLDSSLPTERDSSTRTIADQRTRFSFSCSISAPNR